MTDPSDDSIPRPGMLVGPNVRLNEPLGAGSMGAVWRATRHGEPVAVKFIAANLRDDETLRRRFEREAEAAARIDTPHVVLILDQGITKGGVPFIVMELLEGESLAELLEREGALSPRRVGVIVTQVAKALHGAHEEGIVHRDIKPENIFLVQNDDDILVKVLDFGVAKVTESFGFDLTRGDTVLGTPYYMSAEQIRSSATVTPHADLWSLAVVSYEALTGQVPFDGNSVADIFLTIQAGGFQLPSALCDGLNPNVDGWFERAFARETSDRHASAMELASTLLRAIATIPSAFDEDEDVGQWLATGQFEISSVPPSTRRSRIHPPPVPGPRPAPEPVHVEQELDGSPPVQAGQVASPTSLAVEDDEAEPISRPSRAPKDALRSSRHPAPASDDEPDPATLRRSRAPAGKPPRRESGPGGTLPVDDGELLAPPRPVASSDGDEPPIAADEAPEAESEPATVQWRRPEAPPPTAPWLKVLVVVVILAALASFAVFLLP